eukprot:TRINITY_DN12618_c0_g2_i3.p1 TRINITY_DN12618_c0_g2~~TRINITY_DN12618_c0_g2_i3.p1  ORF type:complete len:226 (+),score=33.18 TRINITY_DN12618_c0_g2_i3:63-740(+)
MGLTWTTLCVSISLHSLMSLLLTWLGAKGPDVIYVGDHLYADVIKCRKLCEWRTLLIVPELSHELDVTQKNSGLLSHLSKLESLLAENPKLDELKVRLWEAVNELNKDFSGSGSLFRSGSRLSYFGSQVMIWADVYTASVNNLGGMTWNTSSYRTLLGFLTRQVLRSQEVAVKNRRMLKIKSWTIFKKKRKKKLLLLIFVLIRNGGSKSGDLNFAFLRISTLFIF